jgi:hypothetical protein
MHSPLLQSSPFWMSQTVSQSPQCSGSHRMLTQTPSQICSPRPMHSPPVVICVVPVSEPSVVPLVSLDDDESLDEVDVSSEVEVDAEVEVEVEVDAEVDDAEVDDDDESEVVGGEVEVKVMSEVAGDDMVFVLDIESVPTDDAVVDSPVVAVVSPPPSSPQAKMVRPTSVEIKTGADPWT